MTVETTANRISHVGNGSTIQFPFPLAVFDPDDDFFSLADAGGSTNPLRRGIDYSVSLTDPEDLPSPGVVTIVRTLPFTQEIEITDGGPMPAGSLNEAFDRAVILMQQLQDQVSQATMSLGEVVASDDFKLLAVSGNAAAARTLLSAQELNANLTAFSGLTGEINKLPYFTGSATMTTTDITAFSRDLLKDSSPSEARETLEIAMTGKAPTGAMLPFCSTTPPSGWVLASGRTIGDTVSGATERANADTEDLFKILWANFADAQLPIYTSTGVAATRGQNGGAQEDCDAHMRITLPDLRGRVSSGLNDMNGSSANVVTDAQADFMGGTNGAETHTLTQAQLPNVNTSIGTAHQHAIENVNEAISNPPQYRGFYAGPAHGYSLGGVVDTYATTNESSHTHPLGGSGQAHNNVQPFIALSWIIKL